MTATANGAAVIRPNVDTLYSRVAVDLSQTDVVITVPPIDDGPFYIFPFYDIYGDNFANLGSVTNSIPGKYLMRLADEAQAIPGLQLMNDTQSNGAGGKYEGIVNFPTTYGSLLIRILLRNNGTDLNIVHSYQAQISLSPVNRTALSLSKPVAPSLSVDLLNGSLTGSPPQQLLQLTARLSPYNQPELRSEVSNVSRILELAGLRGGSYNQPAGVNLTEAEEVATLSISNDLTKAESREYFNHGWLQFVPAISGNFFSDFAARAYIAVTALGQLVSSEALYPQFVGESADANLYIGAQQATIFTFSAKPPVTGFWSLTAYGTNDYLIPNGLDVYALGDRSNLTYADGSLVYGNSSIDGPFQILIQPADVTPPENWTNNWLPAPSGGGEFSINLRWYGPTEALSNGSYVYPIVSNHTVFAPSPNSSVTSPAGTAASAVLSSLPSLSATGIASIASSPAASTPTCTSNTTYPSQAQIGKIFGYLTAGNYTAFFANVIEDVDWSVMGTHPLAGEYHSQEIFINDTLVLLDKTAAPDHPIVLSLVNIIGGGNEEWSVQELHALGVCKD
ncbi:MAG: hypothetical protein M1830_003194, partial [Pleopsidium flavum]